MVNMRNDAEVSDSFQLEGGQVQRVGRGGGVLDVEAGDAGGEGGGEDPPP